MSRVARHYLIAGNVPVGARVALWVLMVAAAVVAGRYVGIWVWGAVGARRR